MGEKIGTKVLKKEVLKNLESLEEILGAERMLWKLYDILDDEIQYNSYNLKKRGEYEEYVLSERRVYRLLGKAYIGYPEMVRLANAMTLHHNDYVIADLLASYTRKQNYIECGSYAPQYNSFDIIENVERIA